MKGEERETGRFNDRFEHGVCMFRDYEKWIDCTASFGLICQHCGNGGAALVNDFLSSCSVTGLIRQ